MSIAQEAGPIGEVCIAPVEAIPAGEGRNFTVARQRLAVFRQRDGRLFATQESCPHRGGPLAEGVVGGGEVICPYHSYRFDLTTGVCANDAACRLQTYPVRDEDGWIVVSLGDVSSHIE
jgi:nitrite reductase (NADH) small subunit